MFETKKNMQLVYIVNARMPNVRAHGIQIAHTAEALATIGIDVTLVTPMFVGEHPSLSSHYGITQSFTHRKIFALDIPHLPFRYPLRNVSFFVSVNIYLILLRLVSLFSGEKLIVYVRGEVVLSLIPLTYIMPIFFETHQIRNYERWYRKALHLVRGVIVVTDSLKKKFIEEYGLNAEKILVARDAVDSEKFSPRSADKTLWTKHGIPKEKKTVLYSGTLSAEKGVHTLAEAATDVSSDIQIVFLGGTEEQVATFTRTYGHMKNISILGRVSHTEVPQYVASADILVLPDSADFTYSNLYTSPMKLFEYMATGRPIIASRVPALLEVLDTDSAVFFEPGNAESLATKIQELVCDTERGVTIGARAKEIVSAFTWEKRAIAIKQHLIQSVNVA